MSDDELCPFFKPDPTKKDVDYTTRMPASWILEVIK